MKENLGTGSLCHTTSCQGTWGFESLIDCHMVSVLTCLKSKASQVIMSGPSWIGMDKSNQDLREIMAWRFEVGRDQNPWWRIELTLACLGIEKYYIGTI